MHSCIFRWRCENCGDDKLTSPAHVMRLLLKVEADINQSDDVQKNEVCKKRTCTLLSVWMVRAGNLSSLVELG